MEYLDFEIEIGPGSGREYPIQVLSSPAGEAQETLHFPYDSLELKNRLQALQIALLRSGGKRRKTLTSEEKAVLEFGRSLFDALFTGEVRSRYDVSQGEADRQGAGLRLKLRIQSPELASLPWEFLYDPREAEFICFSRNRPMVRYVDLPRLVKPLKTTPPLQILGMVVGPVDLAELNVEREKQRVEEALQGFQEQGWVKLTWLEGGTWRDLQRALQVGSWHVFHFIGHGGFDPNSDEGLIALVDRDGKADLKSSTQIGRLLADHHSLRLAILNACEGARGSQQDLFSSTAATLVRKGIPAVLAMQYEITDEAAIVFARGFYDALVNGMPIDAAVAEARKAISLAVDNTIEWGTPVLYLRSPDGIIFDLAQTKPLEAIALSAPAASMDKGQKIRELYNRANSAYWLEEWEHAAQRFQAVVELDPEYEDAPSKLEQARGQAHLAELERRALTAREAADWPAAVRALEAILAVDPDQGEAAEHLAEARKEAELVDLYGEAGSLTGAKEWAAALNVFSRIDELDPVHPDPEGLRARARTELAALEQAERLRELHEQSLAKMDAGDWEAARKALREIQSLQPGDQETARLLTRVESELSKEILAPEPADADAGIVSPAVEAAEEDIPAPVARVAEAQPAPIAQPAKPAERIGAPMGAASPIWMEWRQLLADIPRAFDQAGWNLYGRWVAANTFGWIVTWAAATFFDNSVMNAAYNIDAGIDNLAAWAKLGLYLLAAAGLIFGQGLVIRDLLPGLDRWRRLTLIGWTAALLITVLRNLDMYAFIPRVITLGLAGAVIGTLQWTVLRNNLSNATLWVPANVLAWVLAAALGGGVFVLGESTPQAFLPGAVIGIVTGVALVILIRAGHPLQEIQERERPAGGLGDSPPTPAEGQAAAASSTQIGIDRAAISLPASLRFDVDRLDWKLLGTWFVANALGWGLVWGLVALIQEPLSELIWKMPFSIDDSMLGHTFDLLVGAGFFFIQALVIQRALPGVKSWWLLSLAGWEIGTLLTGPFWSGIANLFGWWEDQIGPFLVLLFIGTAVGAAGWLGLRNRLPYAWLWIPSNALAWGLAALPGNGAFAQGETTLQAFLPGAIMGLVTGIVLVLLVNPGLTDAQGPDKLGQR